MRITKMGVNMGIRGMMRPMVMKWWGILVSTVATKMNVEMMEGSDQMRSNYD